MPAITALAKAFESTQDSTGAEEVLEAFAQIAALAVEHNITHGVDFVISTVCSFTNLDTLEPFPIMHSETSGESSKTRELLAFGMDLRSQMAVVATFELARRHGNHAKNGWRHVFHVLLRL